MARVLALAFGILLCASHAQAFGPNGHMAVGTIADSLIAGTPTARRVRQILGSNLRTASVWADCAKGVNPTTFKYQGKGRFAECAIYENPASERQMEAFVRRNTGNCDAPPGSEPCHKQYHYTDVAIQRTAYARGLVGTSDHDIVAAISASIAVLQDQDCPPPFRIASKKEALRILAHYIGDIHQPMHVASVYLDPAGKLVDPDAGRFDPQTETRGANDLLAGAKNLHALWDSMASSAAQSPPAAAVLTQARALAGTGGDVSGWSTAWATESLALGTRAFEGITYSAEDGSHHYKIVLPAGYSSFRTRAQRDQVTKAGARLAQVLTAIWP